MRKAEEESQDDQMMKDLASNAKCTEELRLELDALRGQERAACMGMVRIDWRL